MNKQQAQNIIKETFESSFDKVRFVSFIKNLLNSIDESSFTYNGNYIPDAYKQYIKTLERVGKFSDGENNLDVLIITLQKETSLERARTMQRNFVAWYLNGSRGGVMKDAALVAFVSPNQSDWRFSLVKMDYRFEKTKTGKVKVKEVFTPARRWSFLVGENEKSHTAQSRLVNILADDEHAPTLEELEKAFDIETVTKEFFLKYRELFLRTKEALDEEIRKDPKIKTDFEAKGVDTVNFAKKLLGQILFLYFLQKKGWFGVGRDDDWGTGSKHFLRSLFAKEHGDYQNFFNDILEPLFYEALRVDRSHYDNYYSRFNCKIPFLNGGLFDPIGNYDWVHTDIKLPNELFSNTNETGESDISDGILDIFDRYNFTVREDEPLEKEVAIDPELLGKAYEKFNAIRPDNFDEFIKALKSGKKGEENKFNKKFGVYYTPREIVHYMCKQSLINYLFTQTEEAGLSKTVKKQDIEHFIEVGEMITEHEAIVLEKEKKIKNGVQKSTEYASLLSESIRENASVIDKWLEEITVCDPAVGSGAFPVGMMKEIVRARNTLSVFLNDPNRNDYEFKRHCIEHSLYGVDIDPGAVEIAKLRLWLSLVVDEEDIKNIKPLPNLDYRIMQGNSLISEFMGINFDTDSRKDTNPLLKGKTNELLDLFKQKKDKYLNESNVTKKTKLKEEIEDLMVKIFDTKLKTDKRKYFNGLKDIKDKYSQFPDEKDRKKGIELERQKLYKQIGFDLETAEKQLKEFTSGKKVKPFFLWNLYFSEIFHKKGGFDVVIANPPYIGEKKHKEIFQEIKKKSWLSKFYQGKMDIFYFFFHLALNLSHQNTEIAFITTNYYITATGATKLRKDFKQRAIIWNLINFNELKIFESALGQHNMITILQKGQNENAIAKTSITKRQGIAKPEILQLILTGNDPETSYYQVKQKDLYDGDDYYIRLTGIQALSSDPVHNILNKIIQGTRLGNICNINSGADITISKITAKHLKNFKGDFLKGDGVFVLQKNELASLNLPKNERNIIKPFIKNSDIFCYGVKKNDNKLIYLRWEDDIDDYPNIKKHLLRFRKILEDQQLRYEECYPWFALHRPREQNIFEATSKILVPYRAKKNIFGYATMPIYASRDVFYITKKESSITLKYILALLNSKLYYIWLYNRGKRKGEMLELYQKPLSEIPIRKISREEQKSFIAIVDKILTITKDADYLDNPAKQAQVKEYEKQIDRMVYDLYGLTDEEIRIVEGEK